MRRIAVLLSGDINVDSRVQKEIDTFISLGLQVTLISWSYEATVYKKRNLNIINIPLGKHKSPYGKLFTFLNVIKFWYAASRIIRKEDYAYIHCNDLNTLGVMYFLPKSYDKHIVYDAHELTPEKFPPFSIRRIIWNYVEKQLIKRANTVITPEINRAKYLRKKYKMSKTAYVINNFPRHQLVCSKDIRGELGIQRDTKILCFHGLLHPNRKIEDIIESLKYLPEDFVTVLIGYSFGDYLERVKQFAKDICVENRVFFYGKVPAEEILKTIAGCDVGIALYDDNNLNNYYCAPNKVFDYIMAGVKVITNDYPSLKMLNEYRFVRLISEVSSQTIAKYAKELADDDSVISDSVKEKFSWDIFYDTFAEIYS